jgi:hypothetical protein
MEPLSELLERFRRGPDLVAAVITGAAGAELDYVPSPEKWSIRQILAHLADSEIVSSDRFRRVIAENNPTLVGYDQDAWTAHLNYKRRKTADSLELFRRLRQENYELMKDLPEEAFARTGNHTERGAMTLRELVAYDVEHHEKHAEQLQQLRRQYRQAKRGRLGGME